MIRLYSANGPQPGVRTLEEIRLVADVMAYRMEITDLDGTKTISWEVHCGECDFYENGLTEAEALESGRDHHSTGHVSP